MFVSILGLLILSILIYFKIADHYNIIDKPNERSSHEYITLRGGGIVFYIGVALYFFFCGFSYPLFALGLSIIAVISFIDDIKAIPSRVRIVFHFAAMLLMFYDCGLYSLPWYYTFIALILSTGIINAYNFMDGVNGITGGYSVVVLASFWYINNYIALFIDNYLIYIVLLSLLVFNIFNFRKRAKCFAGDVGSVSIAFIIVFLLCKLIVQEKDMSYIIILLIYGVDTVLTIVHRLILKENIFVAHRKHMYQIMSNELHIPHLYVSLLYMAAQAVVMSGFFVFKYDGLWYFLIAASVMGTIYIGFMVKYFKLHR
ncbi:MAG: UDP-GlcNAc--UDP-phosphate GlcNAc-1-phosphate transferase [Bacteroidetes bacterium GWF2_40_14]|nr:MAG: UDP-GlcNAc--UDP-phosphate GlcNAc-1-phosphate transferase [Bacteroidetes bacterium GWF2_40_14]